MMQSPHGEEDFVSEAKKLFGHIPLALKALWGSAGRGGKIPKDFTFFFAGKGAIPSVEFPISDFRFPICLSTKGSDR